MNILQNTLNIIQQAQKIASHTSTINRSTSTHNWEQQKDSAIKFEFPVMFINDWIMNWKSTYQKICCNMKTLLLFPSADSDRHQNYWNCSENSPGNPGSYSGCPPWTHKSPSRTERTAWGNPWPMNSTFPAGQCKALWPTSALKSLTHLQPVLLRCLLGLFLPQYIFKYL